MSTGGNKALNKITKKNTSRANTPPRIRKK
jgi:hypothetical protein